MALRYVGRYATSGARLADYLRRKVKERGWAEAAGPDIPAVVARCVEAGYVDDRAFAEQRAGALIRRGYGGARVAQSLRAAGIDQGISADVMPDDELAERAAEHFARRRRFGPYGDDVPDRNDRRRQIAAMLRAGHSFTLARRFVDGPGDP